jgi:Sortase domain
MLRRLGIDKATVLVVACVLVAAGLLAGCGAGGPSRGAEPRPVAKVTQPGPTVRVPSAVRNFRSTRVVPATPLPVRLRIPSLQVDTSLEHLARGPSGAINVPKHWLRAGWYENSARPGEPGAAVLLGHVDSPYGPAVFAALSTVRRGARVLLDRADGSTVGFRVTRIELHKRTRFPKVRVYWPTLQRELRLITCGGQYIRSRGGYQSNVVVFATAESTAGQDH